MPDDEDTDTEEEEDQQPDADNLDTIIHAGRFKKIIEVLESVADEAIFRLGRDGLDVRLVDPANVYMAELDVTPGAFESVGDGQYAIGVNLNRINDYLSEADDSELVKFSLNLETRRLSIEFGNADAEIAGIDPDSIRQEPDLPDLDLVNEFTCEARHLQRANKIATLASDHAKLEGDVEDECIRISGDGDTDQATVELREELEWADLQEPVHSLYSSGTSGTGPGSSDGYLTDLLGVIPGDAMVEVTFGDDFPVYIEWSFADGHADVTQMLAPRIQST
jgi:proliferating cell nuclear antigen